MLAATTDSILAFSEVLVHSQSFNQHRSQPSSMLATIGLSLVLVPQTRLHPHSAASSGRSGGLSMRGPPPEIARQLAPDPNDPRSKAEGGWTKSDVNQMWSAFETVYGSRERAEAAANRNVKVLLPFLNSPETIRGSYAVLVDMLGKEEASEIIVKNPGVLSCAPEDLAKTKPGDIRSAANFVSLVDKVPLGVLQLFDPLKSVVFPLLIALTIYRVQQCGDGSSCAADAEAWADGGLGPKFVRFVQDLLGS